MLLDLQAVDIVTPGQGLGRDHLVVVAVVRHAEPVPAVMTGMLPGRQQLEVLRPAVEVPAVKRHQAVAEAEFPGPPVGAVDHHELVIRRADDLIAAGNGHLHQLGVRAGLQGSRPARHDLPAGVEGVDPPRPASLGHVLERSLAAIEQRYSRLPQEAADVNPDRGGHDRAERGDHRPDGRALSLVGVGHQREVRPDEGHGGGALSLLPGARLQDGGPVDQLLGQMLHYPATSRRLRARHSATNGRARQAGEHPNFGLAAAPGGNTGLRGSFRRGRHPAAGALSPQATPTPLPRKLFSARKEFIVISAKTLRDNQVRAPAVPAAARVPPHGLPEVSRRRNVAPAVAGGSRWRAVG